MCVFFLFQAEDGIRDLVRSRGLGDVYKRQHLGRVVMMVISAIEVLPRTRSSALRTMAVAVSLVCARSDNPMKSAAMTLSLIHI